ncbi:YPL225W [Candida oxycetoniae]|uniref:Protein PBDC1 homolog n=1 Tax=Candida oxycetoniae TaxID=497107 RepID=A0AAI9T108_9ASCO|nr:YPL225W [Candida oxycetoniae]KAI3406891.1 YPL225W [Candida oxycetoniae]
MSTEPGAMQVNAENADNLEEIEMQFAVKAVQQAETYWSLLEKVQGSKLKLTKHDDQIYEQLLDDFPEFKDKATAAVISEEEMKSPQGKTKWREFCEKFKDLEDYNFGTLLRLKADDEYGQDTTIFAVRIQFYAIEIARNKYGLNDWIYEAAHKEKK